MLSRPVHGPWSVGGRMHEWTNEKYWAKYARALMLKMKDMCIYHTVTVLLLAFWITDVDLSDASALKRWWKDERVDKPLGQNAQRIIERNMLGSYAQNERESGKNRLVYHTERLLLFLSVFKESVDPPGTWALKRWWKNAGVDNEKHWAKYARALMLKIKDTYLYITPWNFSSSHCELSYLRLLICPVHQPWSVVGRMNGRTNN